MFLCKVLVGKETDACTEQVVADGIMMIVGADSLCQAVVDLGVDVRIELPVNVAHVNTHAASK